jgi:hypothetical protein
MTDIPAITRMASRDAQRNWFREFSARHIVNGIRITAVVNLVNSDRKFSGHELYKKDSKETGITKNGIRLWIRKNDYPRGITPKVGEETEVDGVTYEVTRVHEIYGAFLVLDLAGFSE